MQSIDTSVNIIAIIRIRLWFVTIFATVWIFLYVRGKVKNNPIAETLLTIEQKKKKKIHIAYYKAQKYFTIVVHLKFQIIKVYEQHTYYRCVRTV